MAIEHLIAESETPRPRLTIREVASLLESKYGIRGTCHPQAGERDLNLRVDRDDGRRYLLKVWNHSQDPGVIDLQVQLLRHIEKTAPDLPLARVIPDLGGDAWSMHIDSDGQHYGVCLLSWLEGRFLRDATMSSALSDSLGRMLAHLDLAMADFAHPARQRDMLWDVARTHRLRELLPSLSGLPAQALAEQALDEFELDVLPTLQGLPRQVIHADFNLDNILVGPAGTSEVAGVIDFGDALEGPRVCDLAIACAYQLVSGDDPLAMVEPVVVGYHRTSALPEAELHVLPGLIRARLTGSLVITSHMAALHPENRDYLLVDTRNAAQSLRHLASHDPRKEAERLISACRTAAAQNP